MTKKYSSIVKQVTIACAMSMVICAMIIFGLYDWITSVSMKEIAKPVYLIVLAIYSIVIMGFFCLLLIRRIYVRGFIGKEKAIKDFENGYCGLKKDYIFLIKQEISILIVFALINGVSWIMISIDKLIFSRRTVTAILLLYAPLNIVGVILPEWANGILGYLLGTIFCYVIYLLELVVFRKKWHIHYNEPRR